MKGMFWKKNGKTFEEEEVNQASEAVEEVEEVVNQACETVEEEITQPSEAVEEVVNQACEAVEEFATQPCEAVEKTASEPSEAQDNLPDHLSERQDNLPDHLSKIFDKTQDESEDLSSVCVQKNNEPRYNPTNQGNNSEKNIYGGVRYGGVATKHKNNMDNYYNRISGTTTFTTNNEPTNQVAKGQEEIAKGQGEVTKGQEEIAKGQGEVAKGQEEVAKGQEEVTKGQEEVAKGHGDGAKRHAQCPEGVENAPPFSIDSTVPVTRSGERTNPNTQSGEITNQINTTHPTSNPTDQPTTTDHPTSNTPTQSTPVSNNTTHPTDHHPTTQPTTNTAQTQNPAQAGQKRRLDLQGRSESVAYEAVGFFGRFLNALVILAAVVMLGFGLVRILSESGVDIDGVVEVGELQISFSAVIMLALQLFVAAIWLLCFTKAAKISAICFAFFAVMEFLFCSVFVDIFGSVAASSLLALLCHVGLGVTLMLVAIFEQFIRPTRGFCLLFAALYIVSSIVLFVLLLESINLPEALTQTDAVTILKIFSNSCHLIMFLTLNPWWKKRKLKN